MAIPGQPASQHNHGISISQRRKRAATLKITQQPNPSQKKNKKKKRMIPFSVKTGSFSRPDGAGIAYPGIPEAHRAIPQALRDQQSPWDRCFVFMEPLGFRCLASWVLVGSTRSPQAPHRADVHRVKARCEIGDGMGKVSASATGDRGRSGQGPHSWISYISRALGSQLGAATTKAASVALFPRHWAANRT